ncbi:hypothetical protein AALO_G00268840 [Alosa alosa]|uniref:Uncharacterized protein n=1 Tax=Alosa alosa TaxID=278164 RepID=A0AAV6FLQ5_9TELE|nr:hypothetical protein AALO_G00268840 [Alosa alosa]
MEVLPSGCACAEFLVIRATAIECEGKEAGNGVWRYRAQSDKRCLNIAVERWPETAAVLGTVTEQLRVSSYLIKEILWSFANLTCDC